MSDDVVRLMEANLLEVFNERDPQRRRAAIRRTYAADVRWADEAGVVVGHDRLHAKAQELLDGPLAGLSFRAAGPVHQAQEMGYLAWDVVAGGSSDAVISGFDVAIIEHELIDQLFTVVTTTPE
jgi:hypothetical protein